MRKLGPAIRSCSNRLPRKGRNPALASNVERDVADFTDFYEAWGTLEGHAGSLITLRRGAREGRGIGPAPAGPTARPRRKTGTGRSRLYRLLRSLGDVGGGRRQPNYSSKGRAQGARNRSRARRADRSPGPQCRGGRRGRRGAGRGASRTRSATAPQNRKESFISCLRLPPFMHAPPLAPRWPDAA